MSNQTKVNTQDTTNVQRYRKVNHKVVIVNGKLIPLSQLNQHLSK